MATDTTTAPGTTTVTGIGFVTAFVEDFDQAYRFYTEMLGLKDASPMGTRACYFIFPNDTGMYLIGGKNRCEHQPETVRMTFALEVENAAELFVRLREAGVNPVQDEPMAMNDEVVWFQVVDPAGNMVEIVGGK
jgi:predicted enzyme related to lactoylglutathione lyase